MDVDDSSPAVHCERSGNQVNLVFNNPARHNAMSLSMWKELLKQLTELAGDRDMRVAVFSGAGTKAFVSGSDISEFDKLRSTSSAVADYNAIAEAAECAVDEFPKPTIAKIRGYCLGGGLGIALGCDIRICSDDASFSVPAANLGLGYNYRSVARLLRLLGQAKAAELFYTGERFGANEALKLGLVNQVVANDELDQTVDQLASTIAAKAPMTLAAFKACANQWKLQDQAGSNESIDALVDACYVSEDYAEGRLAFSEKRSPVFEGK